MERIFRGLVLSGLILFVLWWYFPYLEPNLTEDTVRLELWSISGFDSWFEYPAWYSNTWLAVWVLAYLSLFFFLKHGRTFFLVAYLVSLATIPINGTEIQSPWSALLGDLGTLVDGAILAVAYLTAVGSRFDTGDA